MQLIHQSIEIATVKGKHFIMPVEIIRLEASGSYTNIFFTNRKKILASRVLSGFELQLQPFGFLRTHRAHLVNLQHISYVAANGVITMRDESCAAISRRKKRMVMKLLKS